MITINNDILKNLDLSYTYSPASRIQSQIDENERQMRRIADEAYNNRQKMQKALEATASNTGKATGEYPPRYFCIRRRQYCC